MKNRRTANDQINKQRWDGSLLLRCSAVSVRGRTGNHRALPVRSLPATVGICVSDRRHFSTSIELASLCFALQPERQFPDLLSELVESRATALPAPRPPADLLLAAIGFVHLERENDIQGPSAGGESSRWTDCQATDWTSCVVGSSSYCSDDYGGMVAKRKIIGQPVSAKRCRV